MSFDDDARPEPLVGPLDPARIEVVARALARAREQSEAGHHSAALVTAARASRELAELVSDTARGPDFLQAIRMGLVTESRVPQLDHERDLREGD